MSISDLLPQGSDGQRANSHQLHQMTFMEVQIVVLNPPGILGSMWRLHNLMMPSTLPRPNKSESLEMGSGLQYFSKPSPHPTPFSDTYRQARAGEAAMLTPAHGRVPPSLIGMVAPSPRFRRGDDSLHPTSKLQSLRMETKAGGR